MFTGILLLVQSGDLRAQLVVIAFLVGDIFLDHAASRRGKHDHVGFDHAGRIDDQAGTESAVMAYAATKHHLPDLFEYAIFAFNLEGCGKQIEVGKGRTSADEAIAPNDAHLDAGVLGEDAVFHHDG